MTKLIFRNCGGSLPYTVLPNPLLQDERLTWEQRGMLADMLSRKEDFEVSVSGLAKMGGHARRKIYAMMAKPIELGYMVRTAVKSARVKGKFDVILYEVYSLDSDARGKLSTVFQNDTRSAEENDAPCIKMEHGPCSQMEHNESNQGKVIKEAVPASPSGVSLENADKEESHSGVADAFLSSRLGRAPRAGEKIQVRENAGIGDFDAFLADYRKGAPGAPAGGEASAKASFDKLSPEERVQLRTAMVSYFSTLGKEDWRNPQSISKFLHNGWRDFVPPPVDAAKEAANELQSQIRCVAMDINDHQHKLAAKWWPRPEDVPADIREKALAHAEKEYLYDPRAA